MYTKQKLALSLLLLLILLMNPLEAVAYQAMHKPQQDSAELQLQDMLMLFLNPEIQDAVNSHYSKSLKELPLVYSYQSEVVQLKRINGFRGFHFAITVEVKPVVGPHIAIGKDRMTFEGSIYNANSPVKGPLVL